MGLIVLLAGVLYLYGLGDESLWMDELLSIDRAKPENLSLMQVRPLSYLFLHVWMKFGSGDAWLRGLNVCFSLGSLCLVYALARKLIGESVGTLSALAFAVSPLMINHTQEVRMYAPCIFFGLLGSLCMATALEAAKWRWIILWAVMRWLAILTTPLCLFLLLPDTVLFVSLYRTRPRMLYRFGVGLLLVGALWAPWVIKVVLSSLKFIGVEATATGVEVTPSPKRAPTLLSVIYQFGHFTAWPFGRPVSDKIHWFYQAYSLLVFGLLVASVLTRPWRTGRLSWVAAWAFLPLVPLFVISLGPRSLWVDRYLVFTAPYVFIVLATALVGLWRYQRWAAIAVVLISMVAVAGGLKRYYTVADREDWRGLVATLNQNGQPGDVLVWSMNQQNPVALNHYYQGQASLEIVAQGHEYLRPEQSESASAASWVSELPKQADRVWLAYANTTPTLLAALEEQYIIRDRQTFSGYLDVFLLEPRRPQ